MAWSKNKALPENINGNKEFSTDSNFTIAELNTIVNNSFYGVDFAESMADTPDVSEANKIGTPNVSLVDNVKNGRTYKKFKFSNLKGEKGDKGDKGDQGIQGIKGDKGDANSLSIGSVSSGTTASATITGTAPNQTLNLVIPKGDKGDSVELRVSGGHFQWKYTKGTEWQNLIAVSALAQVDDELSETSTNAVQNKVVTEAINNSKTKLYNHSLRISNTTSSVGAYSIDIYANIITTTSEKFSISSLASYLYSKNSGMDIIVCSGSLGEIGSGYVVKEFKMAGYISATSSTKLSVQYFNYYASNSEELGFKLNSSKTLTSSDSKINDYVYEI